jgi:hypothetical protein
MIVTLHCQVLIYWCLPIDLHSKVFNIVCTVGVIVLKFVVIFPPDLNIVFCLPGVANLVFIHSCKFIFY